MEPPIKLVCWDLDETLIRENSWVTLSTALNVSPEVDNRLYHDYKAGKITYDEWNDGVREEYLKHDDATREGITRALSGYTLAPHARESVQYLQRKGYHLTLISGSTDILVNLVAKDLGIPYAKANNTFIFDDSGRLKGIHAYGDDTQGKADHLEVFADMLGVKMQECACIGDGANDSEMFRRTGRGITFTGSKLSHEAWKVIDSLEEIPRIL